MPLEPIPGYVSPCCHPEHNAPMHMYIPEGMQYRHTCPACGKEFVIQSQSVRYQEAPYWLNPKFKYEVT